MELVDFPAPPHRNLPSKIQQANTYKCREYMTTSKRLIHHSAFLILHFPSPSPTPQSGLVKFIAGVDLTGHIEESVGLSSWESARLLQSRHHGDLSGLLLRR